MKVTQPLREYFPVVFRSREENRRKTTLVDLWMERAIVSFSKERENYFAAVDDDTESLIKAFLRLRELSTASGRRISQPRINNF